MKAVILAAGEGTRLRPLTFTRPKSLIPLGREPAIYHILTQLRSQGFDDIIMVVGPMRDQIINYVGDGSRFGVHINCVIKPDEFQTGTAGSLKLIEHLLDDTFLVAQSDTLSEIPLSKGVEFHRSVGAHATLILTKVENPSAFGVAVLDEKRAIREFQEKPNAAEAKSNLVSTGFYILEADCLDYIENEKFDFANDLFPCLLKLRKKIYGYSSDAFWVDIGCLEGYLRGVSWELDLMTKRPEEIPKSHQQLDSVQNVRVGQNVRVSGPVYIEGDVTIEDEVRIKSYSVIKRGALISKGALIEGSVIQERAKVGEDCRVIRSVIGESATLQNSANVEGSSIGPGSMIGAYANILEGSRIWPNVQIRDSETVNGTVKVSVDNAFYFCTAIGQYTGVMASTVEEFIRALRKVPIGSIDFHIKRRDFEKWARGVLVSYELADSFENLRRNDINGEPLRSGLIQITTDWAYGLAANASDLVTPMSNGEKSKLLVEQGVNTA
jgi:mannose-1-phosphate guanylyltransferase/phosphomannomutase